MTVHNYVWGHPCARIKGHVFVRDDGTHRTFLSVAACEFITYFRLPGLSYVHANQGVAVRSGRGHGHFVHVTVLQLVHHDAAIPLLRNLIAVLVKLVRDAGHFSYQDISLLYVGPDGHDAVGPQFAVVGAPLSVQAVLVRNFDGLLLLPLSGLR